MDLKWLVFLIGHLDLIGMWFNEDRRANIHSKDTCSEEIGLRFQIFLIILHLMVNANGRTCVSN